MDSDAQLASGGIFHRGDEREFLGMSGEMSGYDLLVENFRRLIFHEGISEGNVRGEFPGRDFRGGCPDPHAGLL